MVLVAMLSSSAFAVVRSVSLSTSEKASNSLEVYGSWKLVKAYNNEKSAYAVVEDIYNSVVLKDIVKRHKITNEDLFNRVVKFIIENVGKTFSANSIVNFLKSEKRTIT